MAVQRHSRRTASSPETISATESCRTTPMHFSLDSPRNTDTSISARAAVPTTWANVFASYPITSAPPSTCTTQSTAFATIAWKPCGMSQPAVTFNNSYASPEVSSMEAKVVGVAGLGLLGRGIASCLLAHGIPVVAYDISPAERSAAQIAIATAIAELADRGYCPLCLLYTSDAADDLLCVD